MKIGKQRRDKAYWAAKEIGYRSRASFKLIQLNRKWEFLQKSSVCIDLCAAPGSWMQVCRENMPMSSLVVGVDLAPIKPIPGCIALQDDITTEKCRADLRKELKTAKADLVLHDGAPNVGKNWIHDAYQQSLLTLHAFKLATEFLCKGGWFVTKVFRSKDYQSLIWVLGQFFKKVHATKPAASRNESAEIFVVCQFYLAPDKIDPKFLDPRHVFSDVEVEDKKAGRELINPERQKKPASQGYGDGVTVLYKEAAASDFILGANHIQILNECNAIRLDAERIEKHARTTAEIRECLKDLKVLGMKELRLLKKWRDALRKEFELADKEAEPSAVAPEEAEKTTEELESEEMAEVDQQIASLKDEERRAARRKKKRELKEKQKRAMRLNLKMIIPGDEGPTASEEGLFKISELTSGEALSRVLDSKADQVLEESEDEERQVKPKFEKYAKESGSLDSEGLWYGEGEMQVEEEDSGDEEEEEQEELGLTEDQKDQSSEEEQEEEEMEEEEGKKDKNPLLASLSTETTEERKERKAELWFQKIGDVDSDSDLEEAEIQRALNIVKKQGGKLRQKKEEPAESGYTSGSGDESSAKKKNTQAAESDTDSDSDSDSDSDDEDTNVAARRHQAAGSRDGGGFEVVSQQQRGKKRPALGAEELALGEKLIYSKKSKRDIMDAGWNRYMFDDTGLPDWFIKEEEMHMKRRPELDPAVVDKYRGRQKELNVKTIKKVVEAKARKKRRVAKKLEKAKKKTAALLENSEISSREKATEIKKMYKAAAAAGKKRDVAYVVAKKHSAAKRAKRPAGVKGPYRQVDPRMKKDTAGKRGNATQKKNQPGR